MHGLQIPVFYIECRTFHILKFAIFLMCSCRKVCFTNTSMTQYCLNPFLVFSYNFTTLKKTFTTSHPTGVHFNMVKPSNLQVQRVVRVWCVQLKGIMMNYLHAVTAYNKILDIGKLYARSYNAKTFQGLLLTLHYIDSYTKHGSKRAVYENKNQLKQKLNTLIHEFIMMSI